MHEEPLLRGKSVVRRGGRGPRSSAIGRSLVCAGLAWCIAAHGENGALKGADPQYGGVLNVGTVYVTLSALSWDPVDWAWKSNHD